MDDTYGTFRKGNKPKNRASREYNRQSRSSGKQHKNNKQSNVRASKSGYIARTSKLKNRESNVVMFKAKPKNMDYSLLIIVLLLVMIGLVMVFSSSYYAAITKYENQDPLRFVRLQAQWALLGTIAMVFFSQFDYSNIKKYAPAFYVVCNSLLVAVLFFGIQRNGSKRWIAIGPIEFQPSELMKISLILFLAYFIDRNRDKLKNYGGFLRCMVVVMIPVALVGVANLSTALVIAAAGFAMMFISNNYLKYFSIMGVPILGAGVLAVMLPMFRYRLDRINAWLDPFADASDTGFQTVQSLYAVASGGFFGLGLGQSRQKLGYIPEAYNDIIFSIICEELGLFGATALILLFLALIYKGLSIAMKCRDMFGSLVAAGITFMVAVQVIINIAVNTNAIPVTGMPLPFISYGGSSLLIMMSCMGVLLNISKYARD